MDNDKEQSKLKTLPFIMRGETVIFEFMESHDTSEGFGMDDDMMMQFSKFVYDQLKTVETYPQVLWNIYDEFGMKAILMMACASLHTAHEKLPHKRMGGLKKLLEDLFGE